MIGVDTGLEETLENRRVTVLGRQRRRADPVAVGDLDIGPRVEQQPHQLRLVDVHRPQQRRGAVRRRRVDVGT